MKVVFDEIRYPVWWEPPDDPNGDDEADRMAHIFHECDGIPGDIAIARVWDAEHARRIAAALNATKSIPTETLEAGVVVVPAKDLPDPEKLRLLADLLDKLWPDDDDPEVQTDLRKWARNIEAALSRLQQGH